MIIRHRTGHLSRRGLLAAALSAAWVPQGIAQARRRRIAWITSKAADADAFRINPFRSALQAKGWIEGKTIDILWTFAVDGTGPIDDAVAKVMAYDPEVVVAETTGLTQKLNQRNGRLAVVALSAGSLEGVGLIDNIKRPGRNVTGNQMLSTDLIYKRVELIKEIVPHATSIVFIEPLTPVASMQQDYVRTARTAAEQYGLTFHHRIARKPAEFDEIYRDLAADRSQVALVPSNPLTVNNVEAVVSAAAKHKVIAIYEIALFVKAGGLLSYGPNRDRFPLVAADYVDQILRGAQPGDLPIYQSSDYELALNLNAAKEIGISIPHSVLARAVEVVE
jgi:putative tryptophan/tyrosine transport system substrate-binding protein